MPYLSRWTVRLALTYFGLGLTGGALLLIQNAAPLHPAVPLLRPLHVELLLVGWFVQMIFGVAYWILPRFGKQRRREAWATSAIVLLNLGVWLTGLDAVGAGQELPLELAGRMAEGAAAVAFAVHVWPRVKPPRPHR